MSADIYPLGIKPGALAPVTAFSIYRFHQAVLPARMAWLAPDALEAFKALEKAVNDAGGFIYLSDCFRSTLDQARARYDYLTGASRLPERNALVAEYPELRNYEPCNGGLGKKAYSPPPGLSWHEAGRAIDVDMDPKWLLIPQDQFWKIATELGWICGARSYGDPRKVDVPEEWHWQYEGPFHPTPQEMATAGVDMAPRNAVRKAIAAIREGT
jgi:hypothetical protein